MPTTAALDLRPSRVAYPSWLRRKFRIDAIAKGRAHYEAVGLSLRAQVLASPFWRDLVDKSADFAAEYRIATNFDLFVGLLPEIYVKSWERFLDKTYRKNVQDNLAFPDPPEGGWLVPPKWFSDVKDIVRTLFVVKYLDGVDYLGSEIERLAATHGVQCEATLEFTELGYYAGHVVAALDLEVPLETWEKATQRIAFEIQITTQVQEVIRRLLHTHYERHQQGTSPERPWQWEYRGAQFSANYLGHILHYLEGQIMKVREEDA